MLIAQPCLLLSGAALQGQGETKHPGEMWGQAQAVSGEAFQAGFDPLHFVQKAVELGQS